MLALADESARTGDDGLYLVALAILPLERAAEIRSLLRALLPARQRRFHWRKDGHELRALMLGSIPDAGIRGAVFLKRPTAAASQRRSRALCLEAALWYLKSHQVTELVIESRGRPDADDRRTLIAARRAGIADPGLRYSFARPLEEPLLWIPDAIAGAASHCEIDPGCVFAAALERLDLHRERVR